MRPDDPHALPDSPAAAIRLQEVLRDRVCLKPYDGPVRRIAGIDVGHDRTDNSHAAIVVVDALTLKPVEMRRFSMPTRFPYVPGLLSFREVPAILQALCLLESKPDILMVDGQGIAHPRRLGIAAHLGALTGMPALGVAKSRLFGRYHEPGPGAGDHSPLMDGGEQIGTVLRSKKGCLPLFISPGHRLDQAQALKIAQQCLTRYRLPEPTRLADKLTRQALTPSGL